MTTLLHDLRFAWRSIRRNWVLTSISIVSLAVAIGGNATVFSLVDGFLYRPLAYEDPERLVVVAEAPRSGGAGATFYTTSSLVAYSDLAERSRTVDGWGASRYRGVTVRGDDGAEPVSALEATPSYLDVLGVTPALGRGFRPEEGRPGGPAVVLLTHDFWVDRFGSDRGVLGETLVVDGQPREVVGVLPAGFEYLESGMAIWLPLTERPEPTTESRRNVTALGRLAPSATTEQVRTEMEALATGLSAEYPETFGDRTLVVHNVRHDFPPRQTRLLFLLLQGSVMAVLMIACVNIANLLMVRGRERAGEIALRSALGADRLRITRQLLTETAVLVVAGALAGLVIAGVGIEVVSRRIAPVVPTNFAPSLNARVLLFTGVISGLAGLAFGLLPAWRTFRSDHASALKEEGGGAGFGRGARIATQLLVVAEVALSFVALGGGSVLVRAFHEARGSSGRWTGADRVMTAVVRVPREKLPDAERRRLLRTAVERAGALPDVEVAAMAGLLPQSTRNLPDSVRLPGDDPSGAAEAALVVTASPGYADALGIGLLSGRFVAPEDRDDAPPIAVVSAELAARTPHGMEIVGRAIQVRGRERTVVGVAEDVAQVAGAGGSAGEAPVVYLPWSQEPGGVPNLLLRAGGDPLAVTPSLRRELRSLDPDAALANVRTLEDHIDQAWVGIDVFSGVLGGFGIVALLLAALGTYGVLAHAAGRRRREIGIRIAMGARASSVVLMIARRGLLLGSIGLALGGLLTIPLLGAMRASLTGILTVRSSTLVGIAVVLFAATALASVLPAIRASAIDPVRALRSD